MRQETTSRFARGLVVFALVTLAASTFAIGPTSAQGSGAWTLSCKGNANGGVQWVWLLNGTPMRDSLGRVAGGGAACSGVSSLTGLSGRPAGANSITVSVSVHLGPGSKTNTRTDTFDPTASFQLHLGASMSDWVCVFSVERSCLILQHLHEDAHFDLQG